MLASEILARFPEEPLEVPLEHPVYAGHFPDNPIVPAALLLLWLQQRVESAAPGLRVSAVPSAKFLAPVRPGDRLALAATQRSGSSMLRLTASTASGLVCRMTFELEPAR